MDIGEIVREIEFLPASLPEEAPARDAPIPIGEEPIGVPEPAGVPA